VEAQVETMAFLGSPVALTPFQPSVGERLSPVQLKALSTCWSRIVTSSLTSALVRLSASTGGCEREDDKAGGADWADVLMSISCQDRAGTFIKDELPEGNRYLSHTLRSGALTA